MCWSHGSMLHNQLGWPECYGQQQLLLTVVPWPWRCLSPATHCSHQHWRQLFSFHESRTSQTVCWVLIQATCMSGTAHTHPPHAQWRLSLGLRSPGKCRVHLASGVSRGAAWCGAEAQIKCCCRWCYAQSDAHCCQLPIDGRLTSPVSWDGE